MITYATDGKEKTYHGVSFYTPGDKVVAVATDSGHTTTVFSLETPAHAATLRTMLREQHTEDGPHVVRVYSLLTAR